LFWASLVSWHSIVIFIVIYSVTTFFGYLFSRVKAYGVIGVINIHEIINNEIISEKNE
jgi:hypothetical protein